MNAELTMMEAAAQKSDTANPATGQLISGTLRAARTISDTPAIPAYIWCATLAITSDMIGAYWDVSWHLSVGRDTFWTPAHMATQLCGVLGGLTSGFLILSTTFGRSPTALKERRQAYEFGLFDHSALSLLPGVLSP
jgi:hypothetical protein